MAVTNFSSRWGNEKSSRGTNIYWCDCQCERVGEGDKGFGKQHKPEFSKQVFILMQLLHGVN